MLKWMDLAKDERKERYKNRYINENNLHVPEGRGDSGTPGGHLPWIATQIVDSQVQYRFLLRV